MKKGLIYILVFCLIIGITIKQEYYINNLKKELNLLIEEVQQLNNKISKILSVISSPDFSKMRYMTVQIKVGKAGGAGILVEDKNNFLYILTAQHITKSKGTLSIRLINSATDEYIDIKNINRENVFIDKAVDLSLIKISKPKGDFTFIKLAKTRPEIGTKIYTIGHPLNFKYTINEGIVTNYSKRIGFTKIKAEYTQLSAPTVNGNSGGAVLNRNTELVGIVVGIMYADGGWFGDTRLFPNISFAVKLEDIKRFLQEVE